VTLKKSAEDRQLAEVMS